MVLTKAEALKLGMWTRDLPAEVSLSLSLSPSLSLSLSPSLSLSLSRAR